MKNKKNRLLSLTKETPQERKNRLQNSGNFSTKVIPNKKRKLLEKARRADVISSSDFFVNILKTVHNKRTC